MVQEYLSEANEQHYLRPNARLTDQGPQESSSTHAGGLVLHNLRRIEVGLRGERLAPDPTDFSQSDEPNLPTADALNQVPHGGAEGDWQDLETYQREQSIEGGDVLGREGDITNSSNQMSHDRIDKAERKRLKNERRSKQKRGRRERERAAEEH